MLEGSFVCLLPADIGFSVFKRLSSMSNEGRRGSSLSSCSSLSMCSAQQTRLGFFQCTISTVLCKSHRTLVWGMKNGLILRPFWSEISIFLPWRGGHPLSTPHPRVASPSTPPAPATFSGHLTPPPMQKSSDTSAHMLKSNNLALICEVHNIPNHKKQKNPTFY